MTNADSAFISLGADVGGKEAFIAINPHILELRGLLRQECAAASLGALKEIALVLRVDGKVQSWNKSGVDNIHVQKRKGFVSADIFVPSQIWESGDTSVIRNFLFEQISSAVRSVVEQVKTREIEVEENRMNSAIQRVGEQFLK